MRQSYSKQNLILLYRLPVIGFCLLIFWQSSYPGIISQPLFPYNDKVLHFGGYALLSILAARDLFVEKRLWSPAKIKIISILLACIFGLSDEIHQAFVSSRTASAGDFFADCTGSIAGCLFYFNILSRGGKKPDTRSL
jgi:VanZ family protein